MIMSAAEAIPSLVPKADLERGCVYPSLHHIRYPLTHFLLSDEDVTLA